MNSCKSDDLSEFLAWYEKHHQAKFEKKDAPIKQQAVVASRKSSSLVQCDADDAIKKLNEQLETAEANYAVAQSRRHI